MIFYTLYAVKKIKMSVMAFKKSSCQYTRTINFVKEKVTLIDEENYG